MNRELITQVIQSPTPEATEALFNDQDTVFWVDWREEDDAIVQYCEDILQTGSLETEIVAANNEAGFDMFISYNSKRVRVPLVIGTEDRHITLVTLNQILSPDFEIRYCIDSHGSDTGAFLPLSCDTWRELEITYGNAVAKRFYQLQQSPNIFTEITTQYFSSSQS